MAFWGGYGGYGGFGGWGGYGVHAVVWQPAVWVWDIQPAWYGYFSWMNQDIMAIWQKWQQTLGGHHYNLQQRTNLLRIQLQGAGLIGAELQQALDRIIGMERDLGANQYGVVDTTVQSTATTTTTTTSRLSEDQRNRAGNLYLQQLNNNRSNIDPREAQRKRDQILNGQADDLAEFLLQQGQSTAASQTPSQQYTLHQDAIQPPPSQQGGFSQQSNVNTYAPHQSELSRSGMQQNVPQQQILQSPQQGFPQALGHGQQQNALQQFQSITATTTTTTTSNNSSDYQVPDQQIMPGYQTPVHRQGSAQLLQQAQPLQIASSPHTPATLAQFNQQQGTPPGNQSYFPQQPSPIPVSAPAARPGPPTREMTSKEKRDARMASKGQRKRK